MSISVSGGAGSFDARLDDLVAVSGLIASTGAALRSLSDDAAQASVNGSVIASGLLCPGELAAAEAAIVWATAGPDGCLPTGLALEGTAHLVEAAVTTYRAADEYGRELLDKVQTMTGMAVGGLAVVGALTHPLALGILLSNKDAVLASVQASLFEQPWLMEAATRLAPGFVQGSLMTSVGGLGAGLAGGPGAVGLTLALVWAGGGHWPTTDYEGSVGGLISLGQNFGYFQDVGDWPVGQVDPPSGAAAPSGLADVFTQQGLLGRDEAHGQIQIVKVLGADGVTRWIVQIPGTQDWNPTRTDNPVDLTSNVHLMSREAQTAVQRQIEKAMVAAGIAPGDPVMLTGHSQGGIAAAACAADPSFLQRFHVTSVVTGGSPIARMDIPDSVSVMSLEHAQDPVPKLDGRDNPAQDNWVTVSRELPTSDVRAAAARAADELEAAAAAEPDPVKADQLARAAAERRATYGPGDAHSTEFYVDTGKIVSEASDPTLQRWQDANAAYFEGSTEVRRWRIGG